MKLSDSTYAALDRMFGNPELNSFFARVDEAGPALPDGLSNSFRHRNLEEIEQVLDAYGDPVDDVYQYLLRTDGAIGTLLNLDEYCTALVGENPSFNRYLSAAQKKKAPALIDDASVVELSALTVPITIPSDGPQVPCVPFLMAPSAQYTPIWSGDGSLKIAFSARAFSHVNRAGVFNGRRLAVRSDAQVVLERAAAASAHLFSPSAARGSLLPAFNGFLTEELNK